MKRYILPVLAGVVIIAAGFVLVQKGAWQDGHGNHSRNAGQETRQIASLSGRDVEDILAGRGWGFAKPAEFNGYPGPSHILELAEKLRLSEDQKMQVKAIFGRMRNTARRIGAQYVAAERALDELFRSAQVNEETLTRKIATVETLRARLRLAHLSTHLEVTPILTSHQRKLYAQFRGHQASQAH